MVVTILIGVVALLHLWFMLLEMFFWDTPYGRRAFGMTAEFSTASKRLAANQGLYNGFLAAGLLWGLYAGVHIQLFFLSCVVIAGIYGGLVVHRKIFFIQAVPALIALAVMGY